MNSNYLDPDAPRDETRDRVAELRSELRQRRIAGLSHMTISLDEMARIINILASANSACGSIMDPRLDGMRVLLDELDGREV